MMKRRIVTCAAVALAAAVTWAWMADEAQARHRRHNGGCCGEVVWNGCCGGVAVNCCQGGYAWSGQPYSVGYGAYGYACCQPVYQGSSGATGSMGYQGPAGQTGSPTMAPAVPPPPPPGIEPGTPTLPPPARSDKTETPPPPPAG